MISQVQRAEADHYGSDCPMAGAQIEHGLDGNMIADDMTAQAPISLLRKAYGI